LKLYSGGEWLEGQNHPTNVCREHLVYPASPSLEHARAFSR
jgi:hypothetical protein